MTFYDWRDRQENPPAAWKRSPGKSPKALIVGGKVVQRDMSSITAVMFHQMGIVFGVSRRQMIDAGGVRDAALRRRFQDVPAHLVCGLNADVIANAPLSWHLYHGNGANPFTLGVEIEGLFDGRKNKSLLSLEALYAIRLGIKWLVETARAEGAVNLKYALGHRQSHGGKPADPGCEIWECIVEPCCAELGLEPQYDLVVPPTKGTKTPKGRPIPKLWSPNAKAPYL